MTVIDAMLQELGDSAGVALHGLVRERRQPRGLGQGYHFLGRLATMLG